MGLTGALHRPTCRLADCTGGFVRHEHCNMSPYPDTQRRFVSAPDARFIKHPLCMHLPTNN